MNKFKALLAAATLAVSASAADAALYDQPLAANAYITMNGLDWAWASAGGNFNANYDVDLSYQGQFGWRAPTAAELLTAPVGLDFMFAGANVPLGGTDPVSGSYFGFTDANLTGAAACAAAYFNLSGKCDWGNAPGNIGNPQPWYTPGASGILDVVVVRVAAVPLPASGLLLASVLGLFGWMSRRKRSTAVA